ncbi:uncharacterized protein LOC124163101 [Ischnura elegans]|uniref:uncharacterized protein LOC124163101 n=1 Tax=Ischnura elegans TaxID=197161 RepID=UPI001ED8713A|nr:uncharacterized protein LOC124163101 [Ischnura elegans]
MLISLSTLLMYLLIMKSVLAIGKMKQCRQKNHLITGKRNELYELVDAINSQQIIIECHFCEEKDKHNPKIWYKQVRPFLKPPEEMQWNSTLETRQLRVYVNPEHALVMKNYTPSLDEGLYYCQGLDGEENENKFNYLIDTIANVSETEANVGDALSWKNYYDTYLDPINKVLDENLGINGDNSTVAPTHDLKAITEWEPWGSCVACGSPAGQRRRRGKCRLKATKRDLSHPVSKGGGTKLVRRQVNSSEVLVADIKTSPNVTEDDEASGEGEEQPLEGFTLPMAEMFRMTPILSCRSENILRLEGIPSQITDQLRLVPDFIQVEKCRGTCTNRAAAAPPLRSQWAFESGEPRSGRGRGDAEELSSQVEREAEREEEEQEEGTLVDEGGGGYRLVELQHGERLRLVCPGASASSVVTWTKNGVYLGESGGVGGPGGPVDALGTLVIPAVGPRDAANYACAVDGVESAVVGVTVELSPLVKTAEFLRHNIYLGVVVGICLVTYCSGLIVAYTQRHRFRPPGYTKVNTTEEGDMGTGF